MSNPTNPANTLFKQSQNLMQKTMLISFPSQYLSAIAAGGQMLINGIANPWNVVTLVSSAANIVAINAWNMQHGSRAEEIRQTRTNLTVAGSSAILNMASNTNAAALSGYHAVKLANMRDPNPKFDSQGFLMNESVSAAVVFAALAAVSYRQLRQVRAAKASDRAFGAPALRKNL
jgi:hypothetical protein